MSPALNFIISIFMHDSRNTYRLFAYTVFAS
jgi:hypothetical protein